MKDYYSILQIKPEATKEEIKAAYRRLAKKYHPDVNGGAPWAEERFKELQEAYSVLSDYFQKADYDREYAAYYRRNTSYAQQPSSAANAPRPQASAPNRPAPPKQTRESGPQDAAQTKKDFQDYAKDDPRKAQAFSHWMNFDQSSKNSIFDGIKSGKKLRFEFANKVAAWVRILIVFGQLCGITALIVIFPMDGQRQLEQVLGTKLTFNSPSSNEKCEYQIDDASGVTHSATHPKHSYRRTETTERNKEYSPSRNTGASSSSASSERPHSYESIPVSERITDYECECAEDSKPKDFWVTEDDNRTHNSRCPRYGKGEGMYSAQGSGTDCPDCDGAKTVSPKTEAPSAPAARPAPDQVVYWVSLNDGLVHNSSCSQYCSGRGYYTTTPTANSCPQCGGAKKVENEKKGSDFFLVDGNTDGVYWYSFEDGLRHRDTCEKFGKGSDGYFTKKPKGRPCAICCHDEPVDISRQESDKEANEDLYWISASDNKIHNASCIWYGKYQGRYSSVPFGRTCPICGGAK